MACRSWRSCSCCPRTRSPTSADSSTRSRRCSQSSAARRRRRDGNLTGFGAFLGGLAAIGFILALLSSGATWIMGADRAEAVACYDGAGPRVLGYFSKKYGTPLAVNLASGVLATIVLVLAVELTERQHSQVLHGGARPGDLDHDDLLPRHLPGPGHPALQVPQPAPAVHRLLVARAGTVVISVSHDRVGVGGDASGCCGQVR